MRSVTVRVAFSLSEDRFRAAGRPRWWVAYTLKAGGRLQFVNIGRCHANHTLAVTVEVPDHAVSVVAGIKGLGQYHRIDLTPTPRRRPVPWRWAWMPAAGPVSSGPSRQSLPRSLPPR